MIIRPARSGDLAAILAFWNPLIRDTTVTFSSQERSEAGLGATIAARETAGRAFLVAEADGSEGSDGTILGFATYDQFRGGNGYVHAMEHTIILSDAARGRGIGRALMAAIEDHARERGAHTMVAAVSAENRAGIAFHRALDYQPVGHLPQSGRKFGRWLDLVLLQKIL